MTDVAPILAGDVRAAARLMRDLDDRRPDALDALKALFPHTGQGVRRRHHRQPRRRQVDRGRRADRALPRGGRAGRRGRASIRRRRSPAARSSATASACSATRSIRACSSAASRRAATSAGCRARRSTSRTCSMRWATTRILIETVGVGQDEVDVMRAAHTTVVVTVPGLGDDIQAIKAGLLEVADVLVVNKADREGADRTERDLMHMLDLRAPATARTSRSCARSRRAARPRAPGIAELGDRDRGATARARGAARSAARARPRVPRRSCGARARAARRSRRTRDGGARRARRDRAAPSAERRPRPVDARRSSSCGRL